jgi:endonuclease-3
VPRESTARRAERVAQLSKILRETYPDAHCELNHSNPLELLIATILSAQCTDRQVNVVTADLFQKYRSAADYANAPLEQLEADVRRIGLYRNKAKNIQSCCRTLVAQYGGDVPRTMDELTALDGVGRKTANVVLGNGYGINVGFVVDTHVARLSERLSLSSASTPEKIEQDLMKLFATANWAMASHWLIWHGRRRCSARKPDCDSCEIAALCPSGLTQRNGNS